MVNVLVFMYLCFPSCYLKWIQVLKMKICVKISNEQIICCIMAKIIYLEKRFFLIFLLQKLDPSSPGGPITAVLGGNKADMNIISKLSKIIRIC